MLVDGGLLFGASRGRRELAENVDDIIVRLGQLRLRKVWQQTAIPAVAVDDKHLLAAVARHLVGGFLQQRQLQFAAIGNGAGFVPRLEDLPEVVFRKDHRIFLLGGVQ